MKTSFKKFGFGTAFTMGLILPAWAQPIDPSQVVPPGWVVEKVVPIPVQPIHAPASSPKTLTFTQSRFYEASAMETSVAYSDLYGAIFSAQYTRRLGNWTAFSLLGEGGKNQYRANATVGVRLPENQLLKLSVDQLAQRMTFDFATQDATTWVGQTAVGGAYTFLRPKKVLNSFFINGYWSQAQSKSLSTIQWIADDAEWENDRRIAGGTAQSGEIGIKLLPFSRTLIGMGINYGSVQFHEKYNSTDHDSQGIGGSITLDQLLSNAIKLHVIASDRTPMQHYGVDLDYSPRLFHGNRLALKAGMAYDVGGRGLSNDAKATVSLCYTWGVTPATTGPAPHITLGADGSSADLMVWTHTPAVKMSQVLAIADQRVRRLRNVVVIALSGNGQWTLPSTELATSQEAGTMRISTLRGSLDANSILEQLAKTTDSQGHALSDYLSLTVTGETAQSVTVMATWLPAAEQLAGFDAFALHIAEGNAEDDTASAILTLAHHTEIPLASDTLKTIAAPTSGAINAIFPAATFTHVDDKTTYKICAIGATDSSQCQTTMDGLSVTGKSDGSLAVKGTAPTKSGTFVHSIIATNEYGTSQPSPTSGTRLKLTVSQAAPVAKDVNLSVKQSVGQPVSAQFPIDTFSNVDTKTKYEVCAIGATASSQCQTTVDGLHATRNSDGSVTVSGNAPLKVGTTVHSIIAVNEDGSASQPSPTSGARVTVVTENKAPTVKDYTANEKYAPGTKFNVKAIPAGIFSNVDGATHYQICPLDSNGALEPCKDSYDFGYGLTYAVSANADGSVQFAGTGLSGYNGKPFVITFSVIAITPYGKTTPSATHGARVVVTGEI